MTNDDEVGAGVQNVDRIPIPRTYPATSEPMNNMTVRVGLLTAPLP